MLNKILPSLYIDLDCTIYDLNSVVCSHYNHDFHDNKLPEDNTSYSFSGYDKAPKQYFEQLLDKKGIFFEGKPINNSIEIIDKLHNEGYKIYFVSLPIYNPYCSYEKACWLQMYFPWINLDTDIIFTGSKKLLDGENRIILDDNMNYLNWEKGYNICFNQPWNEEFKSLERKYIAFNHDEFYKIIHDITDRINKDKKEDITLLNLTNIDKNFISKLLNFEIDRNKDILLHLVLHENDGITKMLLDLKENDNEKYLDVIKSVKEDYIEAINLNYKLFNRQPSDWSTEESLHKTVCKSFNIKRKEFLF